MPELTQHEKILKHMATDPERWWLPQDFMDGSLGKLFVGYEASARLSELAKLGKLESRRAGKFMARRLKERPQPKPAPVIQAEPTVDQAALFDMPAVEPPKQRFF